MNHDLRAVEEPYDAVNEQSTVEIFLLKRNLIYCSTL